MAPKGSTIYGIVRHVSKSGMMRRISFYAIQNNEPVFMDGMIANLGLYKRSPRDKGEGLIVHGCGMDMIFDVVYNTARQVYDDGYALKNAGL